jgi:drug/metabolite transporter (DMT)-like permease
MKAAKIIAAVVIVIMSINLINVTINSGMSHGVGFDTFLAGSHDPWQIFINCDLVAGLILSMSWIIYRERGAPIIDIIGWVWLAAWWGNIVVAAYVLHAAIQSNGTASQFFMGGQANRRGAADSQRASPWLRIVGIVGAAVTTVYLAVALKNTGASAVAVIGYVAGFVPIILVCTRLGMRRQDMRA